MKHFLAADRKKLTFLSSPLTLLVLGAYGGGGGGADDDYFKATWQTAGTLSLDFKSDSDYFSHRVSLLNDIGNTLYSGSIDGDWAGSVTLQAAGDYFQLIDGSSDQDGYTFIADFA